MKQPEYNEIDSLLRNLASRDRAAPIQRADLTDDDAFVANSHLDADELSSYAEGALPAAARARYTSHLADCDDCRRIVSQLSIATGKVCKEPNDGRDKAATSTWKQALAALFTPAVLRYAVPAFTVVVVALSLFAWRQRESLQLARNEQAGVSPAAQKNVDLANGNSGVLADKQTKPGERTARGQSNDAASAAGKSETKTETKIEVKERAPAQTETEAPIDAEATMKKDEPRNEVAAKSQPTYAPEPVASTPAPKPATVTAKAPATSDDGVAANGKLTDALARRKEAAGNAGATVQSGPPSASKRVPREKAENEKAKNARSEDNDETTATGAGRGYDTTETRTVAGRHFQYRNGAWVDRGYSSSVKTISVARGSEQYRALIADEPEIGIIARQLSGDIILLWKGRAYRIH